MWRGGEGGVSVAERLCMTVRTDSVGSSFNWLGLELGRGKGYRVRARVRVRVRVWVRVRVTGHVHVLCSRKVQVEAVGRRLGQEEKVRGEVEACGPCPRRTFVGDGVAGS